MMGIRLTTVERLPVKAPFEIAVVMTGNRMTATTIPIAVPIIAPKAENPFMDLAEGTFLFNSSLIETNSLCFGRLGGLNPPTFYIAVIEYTIPRFINSASVGLFVELERKTIHRTELSLRRCIVFLERQVNILMV